MSESEIRLEGFADSFKNRMVYCVGSSKMLPSLVRSRLAIVDMEVAHRGRKVLFLQEGNIHGPWLLRMKWDAVFVIRESIDMRLALTYVIHASRPTRLVWAGHEQQQVIQQLVKCESLTTIGLGSQNPQSSEWQAIFWTSDVEPETVEPVLHGRLGIYVTEKYRVKSVLKEIQTSELGLVWSSIGESDKKGSLYWFDPSEGSTADSVYSKTEIVEILRSVADSLTCGTA
jgi:hypothetical protein